MHIVKKLAATITFSTLSTTAFSTGYPVISFTELMNLLKSLGIEEIIKLTELQQLANLENIKKLTEGTTGSMISNLIGNNFGMGKNQLLENFSFLSPADQFKDIFDNSSVNSDSFKTFDSAKKTLIDGFFSPSSKTEDAERIRNTRESAYVNAVINAEAVATAHKEKISSFNDEVKNLQKSVSKADGLLDSAKAQNAILLKLYEASISDLALSASELELKATEALHKDFKSKTMYANPKGNINNIKNN